MNHFFSTDAGFTNIVFIHIPLKITHSSLLQSATYSYTFPHNLSRDGEVGQQANPKGKGFWELGPLKCYPSTIKQQCHSTQWEAPCLVTPQLFQEGGIGEKSSHPSCTETDLNHRLAPHLLQFLHLTLTKVVVV